MIIVVTGGRDFAGRFLLFEVLDGLHADRPITLIRNGGMTGADALSSRWAYERKVDTECLGALWGQFGSKAGPIRNEQMLLRTTDLLAFPGGRGTQHTIDVADRLGIPIHDVAAP